MDTSTITELLDAVEKLQKLEQTRAPSMQINYSDKAYVNLLGDILNEIHRRVEKMKEEVPTPIIPAIPPTDRPVIKSDDDIPL